MEQFTSIRRFVRYGAPTSAGPAVTLSPNDLLAGLPKDRVPLAHAICVSWQNGRVVGQVTLFCQFHYWVVLADGGFVIPPTSLWQGSLFNPHGKQIVPLTDTAAMQQVAQWSSDLSPTLSAAAWTAVKNNPAPK